MHADARTRFVAALSVGASGSIHPQTIGGIMRALNGFVVGALAVAVVVLGYLYYRETQNNVSLKIELPRVQVDK